MMHCATLHIGLTPGHCSPRVGSSSLNEFGGGPEILLSWLENQLGLRHVAVPKASRITEYAGALETAPTASFSRSLATDRWATATELLNRRDELRLAGWEREDRESLPVIVRDLAKVEAIRPTTFPDEAFRLRCVLQSFAEGQQLPPHRCVLYSPVRAWPALWQQVLSHLTIVPADPSVPRAPAGTMLHAGQTIVCGGKPVDLLQDDSFRYLATRSETSACEFLAAALAAAPQLLSQTVVYCANEALALRLDACLDRIGLPTMGVSAQAGAHPALQVLPLALALCWEPVDPKVLLDFLMLPISPLRRNVSRKLIDSLTQQPGIGSEKWDEAVAELCSPANDPDGKTQTVLQEWLFCERRSRNDMLACRHVRARCNLVARWAMTRALMMEQDATEQEEMISSLLIAGRYASLLGDLAESQGADISEPQLARLYEEVVSDGIRIAALPEACGGPVYVRSLAEITAPFKRLIWLGLGAQDCPASHWPTAELQSLKADGIDLDDGSRALAELRAAEARGFAFIEESFLAVLLPQDASQRWHPLWLAMRRVLKDCETPPCLEELLRNGGTDAVRPFVVGTAEYALEPSQGVRTLWTVPKKLLRDRETVSASELQDRLGCPLKWVLNYQAKIRPSAIAEIPESFQLKGTFCHGILERLFRGRTDLPTADEAVALVAQLFDDRLPLDAAPLAQPHQLRDQKQLRKELINATRVLITTLVTGGYRITGIEVEVSGTAFGKELAGSIDCLAEHADGHEAVIDFKYAGRSKYQRLLVDGRAVQLATYAHGRSARPEAKGRYPCVAYLVLADGQLFSPAGSPLLGEGNRHVVDGPAIRDVWRQFSAAIDAADGWLSGKQPIPARPLQDPADWPSGVSLVLDADLPGDKVQEPCRYCSYQQLCGLHQLQ